MQSLTYFRLAQYSFKIFLNYFKNSILFLSLGVIALVTIELLIPGLFTEISKKPYDGLSWLCIFFYIGCSILFLLVVPLLINQFFYKKSLKDLGFWIPNNKGQSLFLICCALAITVPAILYVAKLNSFQSYYSLHKPPLSKLIFIILFILPAYYFCEEFFFRGFLFLNAWRRVGWHSFWIMDIIFMYCHIGKPWMEVLLALPVGTVLALLTLKTKSIYPSMIVHYVLGVTMLLVVNQVI